MKLLWYFFFSHPIRLRERDLRNKLIVGILLICILLNYDYIAQYENKRNVFVCNNNQRERKKQTNKQKLIEKKTIREKIRIMSWIGSRMPSVVVCVLVSKIEWKGIS